ncbi:MAG: hypothetical protein DCC74_06840 [Proteobacteria bacterium]|nr:MAG: hypothetical protein DCC74_06840 [Pseudomonadota bacterium]
MTDPLQNAAVDRTLRAYFLMHNLSDTAAREAHDRLVDYVALLVSAGERDLDRLTLCGLTYLRKNDGARAPSRAFTGL